MPTYTFCGVFKGQFLFSLKSLKHCEFHFYINFIIVRIFKTTHTFACCVFNIYAHVRKCWTNKFPVHKTSIHESMVITFKVNYTIPKTIIFTNERCTTAYMWILMSKYDPKHIIRIIVKHFFTLVTCLVSSPTTDCDKTATCRLSIIHNSISNHCEVQYVNNLVRALRGQKGKEKVKDSAINKHY